MFDGIKKLQWQKIFISGFIFLIIAAIVRQFEVILTMTYYQMPEFFGVWSKLMMPSVGPPPASFLFTSLLFSFLTGVTLAGFYDFVKSQLPKNKTQRIFCFTEVEVVLSLVFFSLPVYLLFNLPFVLLVSWFVSSAVIFLLSSAVFVKLLK